MSKEDELKQIEIDMKTIAGIINDPELCEGTASTYSRISGYFRPTENWNDGKVSEWHERVAYKLMLSE
jgi:ribonucleoside-triphosphate reductase